MTLTGRVSPFGNPRIDGCSPLPTAYRSVLRPSSPLSAKAFTRCPYALDLCLEFFTHRDKRPCRSSSKPHSYTQRFFMTANQFGTPTPLPVPQFLAERTSQRLAGARKDPVRSQNAFLSTMTNSAPETTTKIRSGIRKFFSPRSKRQSPRLLEAAGDRFSVTGTQSPELQSWWS
jgi:hypothetical protein